MKAPLTRVPLPHPPTTSLLPSASPDAPVQVPGAAGDVQRRRHGRGGPPALLHRHHELPHRGQAGQVALTVQLGDSLAVQSYQQGSHHVTEVATWRENHA